MPEGGEGDYLAAYETERLFLDDRMTDLKMAAEQRISRYAEFLDARTIDVEIGFSDKLIWYSRQEDVIYIHLWFVWVLPHQGDKIEAIFEWELACVYAEALGYEEPEKVADVLMSWMVGYTKEKVDEFKKDVRVSLPRVQDELGKGLLNYKWGENV